MWVIQVLELIFRGRRFILTSVSFATLVAVIISFLLPKHYRATTTILPPDQEPSIGGLMGLSVGHIAQAVTSFSLPILATPSDLYASILKSDTVLVRVVDNLELAKVYESETRWQAVRELRDRLSVRVEQQGIIKVEVESLEAERSARIANEIVDQLDAFNQELQQKKGRVYSAFLERRLREADSALQLAADAMRTFQRRYKAVSLEAQSEALIKTLAEQKGQLTADEIELEILLNTLSLDHPAVTAKKTQILETRRRLLDIERGSNSTSDSVLSALDIPLTLIPDLSLQYAVLVRNLKIQEVTFEMLSQQNELYRLQAHRDTPTISILDRARAPELAFKPKKRWIVAVTFFLSFVIATSIVVFREAPPLISGLESSKWTTLKSAWFEILRKPLG